MESTNITKPTFQIYLIICTLIVALKLFGIVNVSWWIILSPIWGAAVFGILIFISAVIASVIVRSKNKKR